MKALTICQPYADMIVKGEKVIENRTWPTSVRGRIAIHAGKSKAWLESGEQAEREWAFQEPMVFGAVVATAELYDCKRLEDLTPEQQQDFHANGPWCFMLRDIQPVTPPVSINGAQGFWNWESAKDYQ